MPDLSLDAVVDAVPEVGDLLGPLLGGDRFRKLFNQDESEFRQYSDTPTDRRLWSGVKDLSSPEYFFLLKYANRTTQIPFNVNPQREIIVHPHAVVITDGQGGGKVIQSEGMLTKDITIQGRCGLYPRAKKSPLPTSGIGSGLEQIKFLETTFERYCFLKRYGDIAKNLQLIYVNRRFGEAWAVEPGTFTREDTVESNFNFGYTISLKTLYPYNGQDAKGLAEQLFDMIPFFDDIDAIVQGFAETVDNLNAVLNKIAAVVDGFSNIVFGELTQLSQAVAELVFLGSTQNKAALKQSATKSLALNLQATANALEAAGAPMDLVAKVLQAKKWVNKISCQQQLFQPQPNQQAQTVAAKQAAQAKNFDGPGGSKVSPAEAKTAGAQKKQPSAIELAAAQTQAILGSATLAKISQDQAAIEQVKEAQIKAQLKAALASQGSAAPSTVGSSVQGSASGNFSTTSPTGAGSSKSPLSGPLNKFSILPPATADLKSQAEWLKTTLSDLAAIDPANASYKTATVAYGDDIQTLAAKLLGDSGKWTQLVSLNNLQYPYVASQAYIDAHMLTGVIPWGQPIAYAVPKLTGTPSQEVWRNETDVSLSLSPSERAMGNDILVTEENGDAVWGPDADLTLVYGKDNFTQFVRKRVTLRKGRLRRAPSLGFTSFLGYSDGVQFDLLKAEARGLFPGDDLIGSCEAIDVSQSGKLLNLVLALGVRDLQDPILVPVQLPA